MPAEPVKVMGPKEECYYLLGSKTEYSTLEEEQSDELNVAKSPYHALQIDNPEGASIVIEISLDGVNWVPLTETITSTTFYQTFYGLYRWVRASRDDTDKDVKVIWGNRSYSY